MALGVHTMNCLSSIACKILSATNSALRGGKREGKEDVTPSNMLVSIWKGQTQVTDMPVFFWILSSWRRDSENEVAAALEAQ